MLARSKAPATDGEYVECPTCRDSFSQDPVHIPFIPDETKFARSRAPATDGEYVECPAHRDSRCGWPIARFWCPQPRVFVFIFRTYFVSNFLNFVVNTIGRKYSQVMGLTCGANWLHLPVRTLCGLVDNEKMNAPEGCDCLCGPDANLDRAECARVFKEK